MILLNKPLINIWEKLRNQVREQVWNNIYWEVRDQVQEYFLKYKQ